MWQVLDGVKHLAISFLDAAEKDIHSLETKHGLETGSAPYRPALESCSGTNNLSAAFPLSLPFTGLGAKDLEATTTLLVEHSVNTSSPSFLDKLWSSPSIPGIAADLLISSLNGNSHVFRVSPALTLVEKHVGSELASLFGLCGPYSGGITMPGGAASNTTALLIARNVRFPETKDGGVAVLPRPLAVFVSESAHYSATLAAQIVGLGTQAVRKVSTTVAGTMDPTSLRQQLHAAVKAGHIPLFVAATAGTTVRGAYDPLRSIGRIAHEYGAWFHVDGCWGGAAIFSEKLKHKLDGSELADSIAFNPHKMLGVPQICSFLLGGDLRMFWCANRLTADYLFHDEFVVTAESDGKEKKVQRHSTNATINHADGEVHDISDTLDLLSGISDEVNGTLDHVNGISKPSSAHAHELANSSRPTWFTPSENNGLGCLPPQAFKSIADRNWRTSPTILSAPDPKTVLDLASFTTQCGRRPDALKLYLHWRYYGKEGMASHVETAFEGAQHLAKLVSEEPKLRLVSKDLQVPVPCSQVCFYYHYASGHQDGLSVAQEEKLNTQYTRQIAAGLMQRGWMIDYAPGSGREGERGEFLRVVCNRTTTLAVAEGLVKDILKVVEENIESVSEA